MGCGLCVSLCPMENLVIKNGKATAGSRCIMCYRCISSCPRTGFADFQIIGIVFCFSIIP
ncbi:4Fe-4S dicluster domain-containing protein [[Clostridium] symbiosum]|uniref:4Fe-4S dicluster domain-containing protein n=1 Tax=Clostridium symbiosum TaxID=1512 RepID=UPI003D73923A